MFIPEGCFPSHARTAIKVKEVPYEKFMAKCDKAKAEEFHPIDPDDKSVYLSAQKFKDNKAGSGSKIFTVN